MLPLQCKNQGNCHNYRLVESDINELASETFDLTSSLLSQKRTAENGDESIFEHNDLFLSF